MRRRTLITALAATAAFGAATAPAHAELRRVKVTLVTGQQLTLAVDVPPGTPVDQVAFTGLPAEVQLVEDLGPVATPVPTPVTTTTATPTPTLTPAPTADPTQTPAATATPTAVPTAPADGGGGAAQQQHARGNLRGNAQVLSGELRRPAATATPAAPPARKPDGTPTPSDPTLSVATPGPALPGVPNFFIEKFRIPPFLLPIYQAAGVEYGVRWEILAAINEIETDYGRNLNVSSAGAVGWMQFMPVDLGHLRRRRQPRRPADPYNPVDAIFAAARYLRAAGADQDLRRAIFAYNHADWYVDSVLLRARLIGGLPADLVSSLTGLTQGRFPVAARATYAEQLTRRELAAREGTTPARWTRATGAARRSGSSRDGAPVVAVTDGRIVGMGRSAALGRFISLQDAYGNTYTYADLGTVAARYPVPKRHRTTQADVRRELALPENAPAPTQPGLAHDALGARGAPAGSHRSARPAGAAPARPAKRAPAKTGTTGTVSTLAAGTAAVAASGAPLAKDAPVKQRLFAHPERPRAAATLVVTSQKAGLGKLDASLEGTRRLRLGSRVTAGTVLGRVGRSAPGAAANCASRSGPPAAAPRASTRSRSSTAGSCSSPTAIYRAAGTNPFFGAGRRRPPIGQILLMGKDALAERVLTDPHIEIYGCGRQDIRAGQVDRRVLATLEFLAASGLKPTVTSLECGHCYLTASGNVSEHSLGQRRGHRRRSTASRSPATRAPGSITDITIQRLLTLQGPMKPHQIISLMTFPGTDNTFAMADHADHIHVGFQPLYGANTTAAQAGRRDRSSRSSGSS